MDADAIELFTGKLLLRPLVEVDPTALLAIHREQRVMEFSNSSPWTGLQQAELDHRWAEVGQRSAWPPAERLGLRTDGVHS
jgi:hypothetical protein